MAARVPYWLGKLQGMSKKYSCIKICNSPMSFARNAICVLPVQQLLLKIVLVIYFYFIKVILDCSRFCSDKYSYMKK